MKESVNRKRNSINEELTTGINWPKCEVYWFLKLFLS
jgi:hypothetical protein